MEDRTMGLNKWAREFISRKPILLYTEEVVRVYPDGRRESQEPRPIYQSHVVATKVMERWEHEGIDVNFCDNFSLNLHYYITSDSQIYYERLQEVKSRKTGWFSYVETYFLALKDEQGNWLPESLWSKEQIKSVQQGIF